MERSVMRMSSSSSGGCGGGSSSSYSRSSSSSSSYSMSSGGSSGFCSGTGISGMGTMDAIAGMGGMSAMKTAHMSSGMNAMSGSLMASSMGTMAGPVGHVSTLMPTICSGGGASGAHFSQSSFSVSGGMVPGHVSMVDNLNGHMTMGNVHSMDGGSSKVVKVTEVFETTPTVTCDRSSYSYTMRSQSHF